MRRNIVTKRILALSILAVGGLAAILPLTSSGHCDTLSGPVVKDGRAALETGNLTPVLKWVKPDREAELRKAFDLARTVRTKGAEAKEVADLHFLETLVRLHRAGEGAPFAGLKDEPVEPIVAMSDKALANGSDRALVQALTGHMAKAIRERFETMAAAARKQGTSVAAGREFVEAYVTFTHYVESLHAAIAGGAGDAHGAPASNGPLKY